MPSPVSSPPGYHPGWAPEPPPKQGGRLKWLLIGVAILLVIAIGVGATLVFTLANSRHGDTASSAISSLSDIASGNDTGPISIITTEPTCAEWGDIQTSLANSLSNGWADRDPGSESSSWTPQVRAQYEAAGAAMRVAANQVVDLAKQTPHRVMREMYEQFAAYGRAYADSLQSYRPRDNQLSLVNVYMTNAIAGVCDAIARGGIAARAALLGPVQPPTSTADVGKVGDAKPFVTNSNDACGPWISADLAFRSSLADWLRLDASVLATAWTDEERGVAEGAADEFNSYGMTMQNLGRQQKGVFEDFAVLGALYLEAYAAALPTYILTDSLVYVPGLALNNAIKSACKAVTG